MRPELFLAVFIDVGDSVFHRCDFFQRLHPESRCRTLLSNAHDELYYVERIRAQIVHE